MSVPITCSQCGVELICAEEIETGLCIPHLDVWDAEHEAREQAEWDAEQAAEEAKRRAKASAASTKQPTPAPTPRVQGPQSLNAVRDWFKREDIELTTSITMRFSDGREQAATLCLWPASGENGERGNTVVSLWFDHLADVDEHGEAQILCPDGNWTLDKAAHVFGFDSDAPLWEVNEDI